MKKKKLCVIVAHPDDAELLCYGTIQKYLRNGWFCRILIVTSGNRGASIDRKKETTEAFKNSKIDLKYLDFSDGDVEMNYDLLAHIREELNIYQPNVIITHYPESSGVEHQDHVAIAKAVINNIVRVPFSIEKLLLAEPLLSAKTSFEANYFVDISEWFEEKMQAIQKHKSQEGKFYMSRRFQTVRMQEYNGLVSKNDLLKYYEAFYAFLILDN